MKIEDLRKNWESFGTHDPLWSILTNPKKKNNKWDEEEFFLTGKRTINQLIKNTQKNLKISYSNRKALDFGCGVGRCTLGLADHFEEVIGIDIAASMIKLADQYNIVPTKVSYLQTQDPTLQLFSDGSFSFVYTNITLQHINPIYSKQYLSSFVRILEPQGLLFFQIPSAPPKSLIGFLSSVLPDSIMNLYRKIKYGKEAVMEMHCLSKAELTTLFNEVNAEIIHERSQVLKDGFTSSWYYVRKN